MDKFVAPGPRARRAPPRARSPREHYDLVEEALITAFARRCSANGGTSRPLRRGTACTASWPRRCWKGQRESPSPRREALTLRSRGRRRAGRARSRRASRRCAAGGCRPCAWTRTADQRCHDSRGPGRRAARPRARARSAARGSTTRAKRRRDHRGPAATHGSRPTGCAPPSLRADHPDEPEQSA